MAKRRAARARARAANSDSYRRDLAASRRAKENQRGTCERCGKQTSWQGGRGKPKSARLCSGCALIVYPSLYSDRQRGHGPTIARLLMLLQDGRERHRSELRDAMGVTDGHAANILSRLVRYGMVVRVRRGVYRRAT